MDTRVVLAGLLLGGVLLYLLVSGSRRAWRAIAERRWADRHGWREATAAMADTAEIRRLTVSNPFSAEHPDHAKWAAELPSIRAELAAVEIEQSTNVPLIWRSERHQLDTFVISARTRTGGKFDRHRIYSWDTYVLIRLPVKLPSCSMHVRYAAENSEEQLFELRTGDRYFDDTFGLIAEDQESVDRILTARNRQLLLRGAELLRGWSSVPGQITVGPDTLSAHSLERVPLARIADLVDVLTELAAQVR